MPLNLKPSKTFHNYLENMTNSLRELEFSDVRLAHDRIKNHINKTPIFNSEKLDKKLGAKIFFKLENEQQTSSFKARGAFNAILSYQEKYGKLPEKVVAQSAGNHAQAVAYACKKFNIPALIYVAANTSPFKIEATRKLGAEVVLCEKRAEANRLSEEKQKEGYFFIHPSANNDVILGQATATLEGLEEVSEIAAIFAPCGGGGLISGAYLASLGLAKNAKVFGCEPLNGNDAARSVKLGKIVGYENSPDTIADGARTLAVAEPCFTYLKKLAGILEISEEQILFWQKEFSEAFGRKIEPTSALSLAGIAQFLEKNPESKNSKFLAIISGGNLAN